MSVPKKPREIAVTKMVVNLDGKDVTLTIDEARKLCDALTEIFKTKEIVKEVHHHHEGYRWWYYPTYTTPVPAYSPYTITCNTTALPTSQMQAKAASLGLKVANTTTGHELQSAVANMFRINLSKDGGE